MPKWNKSDTPASSILLTSRSISSATITSKTIAFHSPNWNRNIFQVLQFRQRGALKAIPDDDQFSNESPKISFRWDVESCSTISTSYSAISLASARIDPIASRLSADSLPPQMTDQCLRRKGNWITTDSECKCSTNPSSYTHSMF